MNVLLLLFSFDRVETIYVNPEIVPMAQKSESRIPFKSVAIFVTNTNLWLEIMTTRYSKSHTRMPTQ